MKLPPETSSELRKCFLLLTNPNMWRLHGTHGGRRVGFLALMLLKVRRQGRMGAS